MTAMALVLMTLLGAEPSQRRDCGIDAMRSCLASVGVKVFREELAVMAPRSGVDLNLLEMKELLTDRFTLPSEGVDFGELGQPSLAPAVLPVTSPSGEPHFVALLSSEPPFFLIEDGARRSWGTEADLRRGGWNGKALLLGPAAEVWRAQRQSDVIYAIGTALCVAAIGGLFWKRFNRAQ